MEVLATGVAGVAKDPSIEKQLTRAIKQLIPMIGSDLEEFLQQRRHKQKVTSFDRFAATDPHPRSYVGRQHKSQQQHDAYKSSDVRGDQVFSSAFQYLPNTQLEAYGRRTAKVESELGGESYGHRAEMMGKMFSPARPSKDMMMNGSQSHEPSISQMHHQNLHPMSSLLEMLDDPTESTRELALSLLVGILEKREKALENCIETLVVKLLHATKDSALKVVNLAHICLTTVVTQFDPLGCLRAIASQLVSHDEKILIVSINSLSKLVMRLSHDDLMAHLSTFLPVLLGAFENHSPYVRKAILLCLVDTYLKLGPAVAPHVERLGGAQLLQLVVATSASRLSRTNV